jgi:hypothetical protein
MRKTSTYARKQRLAGATFNGAEWMNQIQRCRTYSDEPIIGSWVDGTQSAATKAMLLVRQAFESIKAGSATSDGRDFDILCHALGVAWLRAIAIAGDDDFDNPMLPILQSANTAMERCRTRFRNLGRWGFDGPALDEVDVGVELYETILQASSPAQMTAVSEQRQSILEAQATIKN